jgi:hypothetical protein
MFESLAHVSHFVAALPVNMTYGKTFFIEVSLPLAVAIWESHARIGPMTAKLVQRVSQRRGYRWYGATAGCADHYDHEHEQRKQENR